MMKRFLALLISMLLLGGAACAEGWVAPATLNDDETNMLSLLGMEFDTSIFDYSAPEGAKTVWLALQELQNGKWCTLSEMTLSLEDMSSTGRIAVVSSDCLNVDYYAAIWTVDGYVSGEQRTEPDEEQMMMNMGTDFLPEQVAAALEQTIPLLMQSLSDKDEMVDPDLTRYAAPAVYAANDRTYAVVVRFLAISESKLYGWEDEEVEEDGDGAWLFGDEWADWSLFGDE